MLASLLKLSYSSHLFTHQKLPSQFKVPSTPRDCTKGGKFETWRIFDHHNSALGPRLAHTFKAKADTAIMTLVCLPSYNGRWAKSACGRPASFRDWHAPLCTQHMHHSICFRASHMGFYALVLYRPTCLLPDTSGACQTTAKDAVHTITTARLQTVALHTPSTSTSTSLA